MCKIWSFEEKKYKLLVNVVEFKIKLKKSFCTCDAHNYDYLLRATFPFYLTANKWQNQKKYFCQATAMKFIGKIKLAFKIQVMLQKLRFYEHVKFG